MSALVRRPAWIALILVAVVAAYGAAIATPPVAADGLEPYSTATVRGRVAWVGEALGRRFGIKSESSLAESMVALETSDAVLPIAPDLRGKAFMDDKRLRAMDVELLVRKYKNTPYLQIMQVYHVKPDGKYQVDYWCEKCAIATFILKECECCQGPMELRERLVKESASK